MYVHRVISHLKSNMMKMNILPQHLKKEKDDVTVLVERLAIYALIATEVGTGVRYWIEQTQNFGVRA